MTPHDAGRRTLLAQAMGIAAAWQAGAAHAQPAAPHPDRKWYEAAGAMKRLAESWGDQSYGAVLVLGGRLAGEGPSRVVKNQDVSAHAEREAVRDAQRRLGRQDLSGAVLYSTSRPCPLCEAAAARAKVSRMYFGDAMNDAGAPHER
jgi:tRNA(Arg) A34 adenosine deaminase TadA